MKVTRNFSKLDYLKAQYKLLLNHLESQKAVIVEKELQKLEIELEQEYKLLGDIKASSTMGKYRSLINQLIVINENIISYYKEYVNEILVFSDNIQDKYQEIVRVDLKDRKRINEELAPDMQNIIKLEKADTSWAIRPHKDNKEPEEEERDRYPDEPEPDKSLEEIKTSERVDEILKMSPTDRREPFRKLSYLEKHQMVEKVYFLLKKHERTIENLSFQISLSRQAVVPYLNRLGLTTTGIKPRKNSKEIKEMKEKLKEKQDTYD